MNRFNTVTSALVLSALPFVVGAAGSVADKPTGFRFLNNRLVVKPYVSLSYTWDSNVDSTRHGGKSDSILLVSPAVDVEWSGERYMIRGSAWYSYNYYCDNNDTLGENSFGERLSYQWTTSKESEKGWSVLVSESYTYSSQADEVSNGGRGVWRDREMIQASAAAERRFTDRLHADGSLAYSYTDYLNGSDYAPLYGYSQYSAGLEGGYAASPWTDFMVSLGISQYKQHGGQGDRHNYSDDSTSYTAMAGLGSRATQKISYRALAGWTWLDYGGDGCSDSGWTYQLSGNWRITRQFQWSVVGSSYYQPSERARGSAINAKTLGTGVSYLTLGDKMTLTADLSYRYEESVYTDQRLAPGQDYDASYLSGRLAANYTFNRWVSVFAMFNWEEEWNTGNQANRKYDFDRYRVTVGLRFHY